MNFGASKAKGDYLLLLNNDTEVITPNWIENMLGICSRKEVGIVGARLFYSMIPCNMLASASAELEPATSEKTTPEENGVTSIYATAHKI